MSPEDALNRVSRREFVRFSRQTKVDRSEKGEGEEGLNRVQRSPRFSNLGVSLVFSDISLLAIGDFFLCVRGRGSRNRDRNNGPSLRKIENDERCREYRDKSSCSRGQ